MAEHTGTGRACWHSAAYRHTALGTRYQEGFDFDYNRVIGGRAKGEESGCSVQCTVHSTLR